MTLLECSMLHCGKLWLYLFLVIGKGTPIINIFRFKDVQNSVAQLALTLSWNLDFALLCVCEQIEIVYFVLEKQGLNGLKTVEY